jgi:D-ribose pyranase
MKKRGILNAPLSYRLARLGHTDEIVVADCGFPIPPPVPVADLAVTHGLPGFLSVLDAVLDEVAVEGAIVAQEVVDANPDVWQGLQGRLIAVELVSHEDLKRASHRARLVIRTGEATPYSNVILRCGVSF